MRKLLTVLALAVGCIAISAVARRQIRALRTTLRVKRALAGVTDEQMEQAAKQLLEELGVHTVDEGPGVVEGIWAGKPGEDGIEPGSSVTTDATAVPDADQDERLRGIKNTRDEEDERPTAPPSED